MAEHVEPWSFLKFPYRKQGWPQGPIAWDRWAAERRRPGGTPLANEEFKRFRQLGNGRPVEGSLFYHYARLIELIYALERIEQLLAEPDILSTDIRAYGPAAPRERGVGVIEAPRGTLVHDYSVDANGLLTRTNLIVATGHNNWAMNRAVESVAKAFVHGPSVPRAYSTGGGPCAATTRVFVFDPCAGEDAAEVNLVGPDGRQLFRAVR
jgi:NAD-reducing hydrogenase large subunit